MSQYDKLVKYLKEHGMQNDTDEECQDAAERLMTVFTILHKGKKIASTKG